MRHSFAWLASGFLVTAIVIIATKLRHLTESTRSHCLWCGARPGEQHAHNCQRQVTEL